MCLIQAVRMVVPTRKQNIKERTKVERNLRSAWKMSLKMPATLLKKLCGLCGIEENYARSLMSEAPVVADRPAIADSIAEASTEKSPASVAAPSVAAKSVAPSETTLGDAAVEAAAADAAADAADLLAKGRGKGRGKGSKGRPKATPIERTPALGGPIAKRPRRMAGRLPAP